MGIIIGDGATVGNVKITSAGEICILLTNETGENTDRGQVVLANTGTDDSFILTGADALQPVGVMQDDGVADGSLAWVTVYGRASVQLDDNEASTSGNWVETGDGAGYGDATNAEPPGGTVQALEEHMREIGHSLQSVAAGGGGTHGDMWMLLHLN